MLHAGAAAPTEKGVSSVFRAATTWPRAADRSAGFATPHPQKANVTTDSGIICGAMESTLPVLSRGVGTVPFWTKKQREGGV